MQYNAPEAEPWHKYSFRAAGAGHVQTLKAQRTWVATMVSDMIRFADHCYLGGALLMSVSLTSPHRCVQLQTVAPFCYVAPHGCLK